MEHTTQNALQMAKMPSPLGDSENNSTLNTENMFRKALEQLRSTSYKVWVATLTDSFICAGSKWIIDDSITAPDGTTQEFVEKGTADVIRAMKTPILDTIRAQVLRDALSKTLLKIFNAENYCLRMSRKTMIDECMLMPEAQSSVSHK